MPGARRNYSLKLMLSDARERGLHAAFARSARSHGASAMTLLRVQGEELFKDQDKQSRVSLLRTGAQSASSPPSAVVSEAGPREGESLAHREGQLRSGEHRPRPSGPAYCAIRTRPRSCPAPSVHSTSASTSTPAPGLPSPWTSDACPGLTLAAGASCQPAVTICGESFNSGKVLSDCRPRPYVTGKRRPRCCEMLRPKP